MTNFENNFPYSPDFNFANLCKIWDKQQAITAKGALTRAERAKKTLTKREQLIAWVQAGGVLRVDNVVFYIENGWGVLRTPNKQKVFNASFSDFLAAVDQFYGNRPNLKIKICRPLD